MKLSPRAVFAADPAKGWRPWGLLAPILGIAFVVVTVGFLQILLQHLQLIDKDENPIGLTGFAAFLTVPFGALGLAVLAWVRYVERRPLATIGLVAGHGKRRFVFGLLTGVAMTTAIVTGTWIAGAYNVGGLFPAFHSLAALGGIAVLLLGFCLQSSVEELLFRGWMLSAIAAKFGVVIAIVLSSLTFLLLHYDPHATVVFAVNVFLFAVFASCWALSTGNIWGVMGWHAGWNWLLATGYELRVTGLDAHLPALLVKLIPVGPDYLTGGREGPEGSILCGLLLIGGIIFFGPRARRALRA